MSARNTMLIAGAATLAAAGTALAVAQPAAPAPKAYVVAEIEVHDPAAYEQYKARNGPIVAAYGGRYLARGGPAEAVEGAPPAGRVTIIEFDSATAARAYEDSPEHRAAAAIRHSAARSRVYRAEGVAR